MDASNDIDEGRDEGARGDAQDDDDDNDDGDDDDDDDMLNGDIVIVVVTVVVVIVLAAAMRKSTSSPPRCHRRPPPPPPPTPAGTARDDDDAEEGGRRTPRSPHCHRSGNGHARDVARLDGNNIAATIKAIIVIPRRGLGGMGGDRDIVVAGGRSVTRDSLLWVLGTQLMFPP